MNPETNNIHALNMCLVSMYFGWIHRYNVIEGASIRCGWESKYLSPQLSPANRNCPGPSMMAASQLCNRRVPLSTCAGDGHHGSVYWAYTTYSPALGCEPFTPPLWTSREIVPKHVSASLAGDRLQRAFIALVGGRGMKMAFLLFFSLI